MISTSDEESETLAAESRRASSAVDRARLELRGVLTHPVALEKLTAFDQTWGAVVQIDARLLPLAVANTNLKATRLSAQSAQDAVVQLVAALTSVAEATSDPWLLRALMNASADALRIQTLHASHIAAADDPVMTRLEHEMEGLHLEVTTFMTMLQRRFEKGALKAHVDLAAARWSAFLAFHGEIIRLSRVNSNLISFELSTHAKREASARCQAALQALMEELQSEHKAR